MTEDRLVFSLKAVLMALALGLGLGIVLGIVYGIIVTLNPGLSQPIITQGPVLSSATSQQARLILILINTASMVLAGFIIGWSRLIANSKSAGFNTLIGLGLYTVVSIVFVEMVGRNTGTVVIHDTLSYFEYIGEPILGALTAYLTFGSRPR